MRRKNNLYKQICSSANLELADLNARKRKGHQPGVIAFDKDRAGNLHTIQRELEEKSYRISQYTVFSIYEPKERLIFRLPYRDRIVQHAIMNVTEPIFVPMFTADTYSCIKGRGIHGAFRSLREDLRDIEATRYCLKLDIKKFYPSIDHTILKRLLRGKFKDRDLLWLLDEIIDSAEGLPIGNYLSQYLANFYLSGFDHWIKEEKRVKIYYRYADDLVILASNKPYLHQLCSDIRKYLSNELQLTMKDNYQVFPVEYRGIDFIGYVFRHRYIRLRKSIKKRFARMMARRRNKASVASYNGWAKHCDSKHLIKKLQHETV